MPRNDLLLPSGLDPEELNAMVGDLAREKDLPDGVYPDLIGPNPGNHSYWGCGREEEHKQAVTWRRRLIEELKRRPEWIAEWRAQRDLDRRIRALCEAKGLVFRPWEIAPWNAPDEMPDRDASGDFWDGNIEQAVRLRRQLIAELEVA